MWHKEKISTQLCNQKKYNAKNFTNKNDILQKFNVKKRQIAKMSIITIFKKYIP